jgi:hypothetical protein
MALYFVGELYNFSSCPNWKLEGWKGPNPHFPIKKFKQKPVLIGKNLRSLRFQVKKKCLSCRVTVYSCGVSGTKTGTARKRLI